MSKIDAQIKELQIKKLKIDYLNYIKDLVVKDTTSIDFTDVKKDIHAMLTPKLDEMIKSIEDGIELTQSTESLTSEEILVLKKVVNKVQNSTPRPTNGTPLIKNEVPPPPKNVPETQELDVHTKMQFAMNNRHLANKQVKTPNGTFGTIVGLDAPYVIVDYGNGSKDKFKLEQVQVT